MKGKFVASCVAFGSALFVGVGGCGLLANTVSSATSTNVHMARKGTNVSRTETADYFYESADNTASVRTSDGNVWLISNPEIRHNGNVTVKFDGRGTKSVKDDRIVSVSEN